MVHRPHIADTREAQRQILEDPFVWQHEAWDALFGSGPFHLLLPSIPPTSNDNYLEAFKLARLAARTPGADTKRHIDQAMDAGNDAETEAASFGMELGALLEQLRAGLVVFLQRIERPGVSDDHRRESLAEDRATLEDLRCQPEAA
jgi:hypothetical protein